MMKILHIITGLGTGGAETMLLKLVKESSGRPESHVVVSLMDEGTRGQEVKKHASLYCLGLGQGRFSMFALIRLFRIVKKETPDVLQGWMYHGNIAAFIVTLLYRKPLVWNIRQSLVDLATEKKLTKYLIKLSAKLSQFTSKIIYNSNLSVHQHVEVGFSSLKSCYIPNGFNLVEFLPSSKERIKELKENLEMLPEGRIIAQIARYHPMKNHLGFIEAIAPTLKKYPDVTCLLIGSGVTHDNIELVSAIRDLGLLDRVKPIGEKDNLKDWYAICDFIVSPSLWGEAFPNIIGEAMACGIPCIVSDVGDSGTIVGCNGFVFEPGSETELQKYLSRALLLDSEEYQQLSKLCRDSIERRYSISAVYDQYIDLYKLYS